MLPGPPKALGDEDLDVKGVTCGEAWVLCGGWRDDGKTPEHSGTYAIYAAG